ncbi:D-alanyl-D-alanine carboxypeptidase-like protein [Curtobacterium sp. PhB130]|uniref:M15 family metallopeptidase n=1 Tax=unclassified Curtobacterium TaxID=257496 RepID=UPI000F4BB13C|nr:MULTISPECIES: M15 family metallopeptidase [unclassified Curtobacterium]ROP63558.1 D-alanyl-D-alanine carboxypeptidase-like protein [Curtobacterium sp. ZW137]ROS77819.1 D-alanyl-D-alanine carboxypeptidase-like protein [Curtobacterium sp. PhB130]TCK65966.1 D-alanyl-D-alanine carboxypeptidase-like protein [Curtobacterium sp. PhB136]
MTSKPSRMTIATGLLATATIVLAGCAIGTGIADAPATGAPNRPTHHAPSAPVTVTASETIGGVLVTSRDGLIDSAPISELEDTPAITGLDADLRRALEAATRAASADGVDVLVNSGWRSKHYQQALLDQGIEQYGSLEAARRWVNTPEKSSHVRGQAVDVGPTDAMSWMDQHGSRFGLCRTYANEMWHFELATTPGGDCPATLPDGSAG